MTIVFTIMFIQDSSKVGIQLLNHLACEWLSALRIASVHFLSK